MTEQPGTHAALMDQIYRRQRYIYDLTRKYYLFGRDRMIRELALKPGQSAVEVGCGTARNLIKIARLYPGAALFGLDASSEMLRTAADNIAQAGLSGRIRLVQGYAEDLSPGLFGRIEPFDRVLFPYSLSMIPDWKQALKSGGTALADDGRLVVVDFGDLMGLGPVAASLLRRWLRLFHVEPRIEILQALESGTSRQTSSTSQISVLPARYAFHWVCGKEVAKELGYRDVATQSQAGGNSRQPSAEATSQVDIRSAYPSQ